MSDSTSIASLSNNVTLKTSEIPVQNNDGNVNKKVINGETMQPNTPATNAGPTQLSEDTINQIVTGIQQASMNGMTKLKSRDIPMDTTSVTQDEQVQPNFVPKPENVDYIKEHDNYQSLIEKNIEKNKRVSKINQLYDDLQYPMTGMLLFFLFQMPYLTKMMQKRLPYLFHKEGILNLSGHTFKAMLFGFSFYLVNKASQYLSDV
jgi:hypothetical protein